MTETETDTNYAILRFEKLKSWQEIIAAIMHMIRELPTPNADAARTKLNKILAGSDDPKRDLLAMIPELGERNADGTLLRRANSVLAVEVFVGTSPGWWPTSTKEMRQRWLDQTVAFLVDEFGADNIGHLQLHVDEQTPHVTGLIVPKDPATGALNARHFFGGKHKMSGLQTRYAARVEHLGLSRGVEGSSAKHERVRRHYGQIEKPVIDPNLLGIDVPSRLLVDPAAWAAEQTKKVVDAIEPALARARTAESDRTARKAAEAQAEKDRRRRERVETDLEAQKALSARLRALPLPEVLDALGFQEDARERGRWRAEGFNITVGEGAKASKWFDHAAGVGRGGAIDLTAHVLGCDFKGALAWLSDRFGPGATAADLTARMRAEAVAQVKAAVAEREPFTPPAPAPEHWPEVRRHLTADRALPATYIDRLHELGDCYADGRKNAVFVCRDPETGKATGAEIKGTIQRQDGTRFTGLAPGSRKDAGGFRIGDIAKAATVYLVESAIDAVSLFTLRYRAGERGHAVISTAGTTPEPRTWFAKLAREVRRVCAFDNDKAGDEAAHKLRRHKFERLKPSGKDWNDDLRAATRDTSRTDTTTPAPSLDERDDGPDPTPTP